MKTFDEAFSAVLITKLSLDEAMESVEFAVHVASQQELANELRDNEMLDLYFRSVISAVLQVQQGGTVDVVLPSILFTVFLAGVRIGQEMEK